MNPILYQSSPTLQAIAIIVSHNYLAEVCPILLLTTPITIESPAWLSSSLINDSPLPTYPC